MEKKIQIAFTSTIIIFFAYATTYAQRIAPYGFNISEIQISGGPSVGFLRGSSYLGNNDDIKKEVKFGYTVGLGLTHNLSRNFSLNLSFYYEKKGGANSNYSQYFNPDTQVTSMIYVFNEYIYDTYTAPLLITYCLDDFGHFNLSIGPFLSYLKKQIVRTELLGRSGVEDQTEYNKTFDFGVCIQVEYNLSLSPRNELSIKLINTLGLINTRSANNYGIVKTNNTSLMFGINFNQRNHEN